MPSIYRPRRPRASLLWQIIHQGWNIADLAELFRHRFLETLVRKKLLTPTKVDQRLIWKKVVWALAQSLKAHKFGLKPKLLSSTPAVASRNTCSAPPSPWKNPLERILPKSNLPLKA